jgi:hypothetical protein
MRKLDDHGASIVVGLQIMAEKYVSNGCAE